MTSAREAKDKQWIDYYLPLAESGDPKAQIAVGWEYARGKIFKKDVETAEKWLRTAQQKSHELAIFNILKLLSLENDRRLEAVFKEQDSWSLGAIYMKYGCAKIRWGDKTTGLAMLRIAEAKGNLYAAIRLMHLENSIAKRIVLFPTIAKMSLDWYKAKVKDPDDERVLI
nr:hypothetical protein [uncultured Devosia sp.]